jgi:serine/threonine protein kinase
MDEADMEVQKSMAGGGEMQFSRDKSKAKLQDFEFRKLIGKGTFGKVFLVQNKFNHELYAMKAIRKDVILEND